MSFKGLVRNVKEYIWEIQFALQKYKKYDVIIYKTSVVRNTKNLLRCDFKLMRTKRKNPVWATPSASFPVVRCPDTLTQEVTRVEIASPYSFVCSHKVMI